MKVVCCELLLAVRAWYKPFQFASKLVSACNLKVRLVIQLLRYDHCSQSCATKVWTKSNIDSSICPAYILVVFLHELHF